MTNETVTISKSDLETLVQAAAERMVDLTNRANEFRYHGKGNKSDAYLARSKSNEICAAIDRVRKEG